MGTGTSKIPVIKTYTIKDGTGKPFCVVRTCPCCRGEKGSGTRAPCSMCHDSGLVKEHVK